jgi:hypothetical protein
MLKWSAALDSYPRGGRFSLNDVLSVHQITAASPYKFFYFRAGVLNVGISAFNKQS